MVRRVGNVVQDDREMELVMVRRIEREEVAETVATISQICNIALQVSYRYNYKIWSAKNECIVI